MELLFGKIKSRLATDFTKIDACQAYSLRILGTPETILPVLILSSDEAILMQVHII